MMGQKSINRFNGEFDWLSNFYPCTVILDGVPYPSSEHAYQAAKFSDPVARESIRTSGTAGNAKRRQRYLQQHGLGGQLAADEWEVTKFAVMRDLLQQKFTRPDLREKLLATGDTELVEGNTWGDIVWGVCRGVGENHLGKMLMEIRTQLRG